MWTIRRRAARGLLILALVTVVAVTIIWTLQRGLIYFPDATPVPPAAEVIEGGRDVGLRTADGLELGAYFVPATGDQEAEMAVLVAPGNGGNRLGRVGLAEELSQRGLAVLLMDYRGYGGNPGRPSEDGLAADADAAVEALRDLGFAPSQTIYFGESLGTGVVAALQARHRPAGVVLRSPFTDLADVGSHHYPWLPVRLLLRDQFPVVAHLAASDVPVTVIYGDNDTVVPTVLSVRVADEVGVLAERVAFAGSDHNDEVKFGPRVAGAVARLAAR